jgi:hypothetical protein
VSADRRRGDTQLVAAWGGHNPRRAAVYKHYGVPKRPLDADGSGGIHRIKPVAVVSAYVYKRRAAALRPVSVNKARRHREYSAGRAKNQIIQRFEPGV